MSYASQSAQEAMTDVAAWARSMQAKPQAQPSGGDAALPPPRNMRGNGVAAVDSSAAEGPDSAEGLRERGNAAFKAGGFADAEALYTRSLAATPTAVAYANRAMARLKLQRWGEAETDCTAALSLDAFHVKALQRRGTAFRAQNKLFEAACDFDTVARLEPGNRAALKERAEAVAAYERQSGVSLPRQQAPILVTPLPLVVQPAAPPSPQQKGVIIDVQGCGEPWEDLRDATLAEAPLVLAASPRKQSGAEHRKEPGSPVPAATAEDATAAAALAALAARPLSAPRNGLEFESAWGRAAERPDLQLQLLQLVDPASLPGLVKASLNTQVLSAVAQAALAVLLPVDAARAVAYLERLTAVQRFGMLAMAQRSADKAALGRAWDAALSDSSPASDAVKADLQRLRGKFEC